MSRTGSPAHTRRLDDEDEIVIRQTATVERCAADYNSDEARAVRAALDEHARALFEVPR